MTNHVTCHMTNLNSVDERERLLVAFDDWIEEREDILAHFFLDQDIVAKGAVSPLQVELKRQNVKPIEKQMKKSES